MTEKLTLEWCFKYPNARIIIADTTTFANVRCMGIPNSPQALDALEKYGQLQLRPLSSLTDEEKKILLLKYDEAIEIAEDNNTYSFESSKLIVDYYRSINIDIDNLQEQGKAVYE